MNDDDKPKEQSFIARIYELVRRSPFEKFKVTMTSGSSYLIESPVLLAVGESRMTYYIPHTDRSVEMRLNQISEVEQTGEFIDSPSK